MVRRMLTSLGVALLSVITIAGTAAAATPTIEQNRDQTITGFFYASCGSFDLLFDGTATLDDVVYYDASGTAIRDTFSVHWHGILYNSVTRKSVDDSGSLITVTDLLTGVSSSSGVARHDTFPQLGLILLDTGRLVVDGDGTIVFTTPPVATSSDIEAACTWFAS